jgi:hypothetical protein
VTHFGAEAGQSLFAPQAAQTCVSLVQTASGAAQSAFVRHSSQTPLVLSQYCVKPGHEDAPGAEHDAWHWWSPGQHAGALTPQSAFERHAVQRPVWQNLVPPPQSPSLTHSTQPSVGSHLLVGHAFAFAHTLPGGATPAPFELDPLHAPASAIPKRPRKENTTVRMSFTPRAAPCRVPQGPEE